MSAYLVNTAVIDAIVAARADDRICWGASSFQTEESKKQLGSDLLRMNGAALEARYGADDGAAALAEEYRFSPPNHFRLHPIAAYKACTEFLYQCTEGSVPEKPLFRDIEGLAAGLASRIIHALPEASTIPSPGTWG